MKHESHSSDWGGLAAAMGDALAFGIGVALARVAAPTRRDAPAIAAAAVEPAIPSSGESAALEARLRTYVEERVEACFRGIEERLRREITEAGERTARLLVDAIEQRLLGRIATLEGEVRRQAETIRLLRESSDRSQQRMRDVLANFGSACEQMAREMESPEAVPEPAQAAGSLQLVNDPARRAIG